MAVTRRHDYIILRWSEKEKKILFEDADEDRFFMTVQDAIVACRVYDKQGLAVFQKQYNSLLHLLGAWSYAHREKLDKVFLTIRDAGLLFLIVTKRKTYDESFEDELTELDIQIANSNEFSQIELSVQALPLCGESNFESFCYPKRTLEYKRANAR